MGKQERVKRGVRDFEDHRSKKSKSTNINSVAEDKKTTKDGNQSVQPETENALNSLSKKSVRETYPTAEDAKTVSALQVPSATDKEALLKRVEKLMMESKHLDQLDREVS